MQGCKDSHHLCGSKDGWMIFPDCQDQFSKIFTEAKATFNSGTTKCSKAVSGVGFEPTPPFGDQKSLNSGRSQTLSLAP